MKPLELMAEVERLGTRPLWPSFDPLSTPVALYDGERTYLFGHPSPPPEFAGPAAPGEPATHAGRHPAIVANTNITLAGVGTATFMLDSAAGLSPSQAAAVVIHEMFHVFQRAKHLGWSANEIDLLTYPFENVGLLQLRRLETEALRRALSAERLDDAAGWAATALAMRRERYAVMDPAHVAYERRTELNEGLATYVERLAWPDVARPALPEADWAPDAVRPRCYSTGLALALLLDRFSDDWKGRLESGAAASIDELLAATLTAAPHAFTSEETEAARQRAAADCQALLAKRSRELKVFESMDGWSVVVLADQSAPLQLRGFDPMNLTLVGPRALLHGRYLRLGTAAGWIEVFGRRSLTEGQGNHPVTGGFKRLTVTGLPSRPEVSGAGGSLLLSADGLKGEVSGHFEWGERSLLVVLDRSIRGQG